MQQMFFQAVLVLWPSWAQISTANVVAQELQLWDSCQLPWCKVVPSKDRAERNNYISCRFVGRHQFSRDTIDLCSVWEALSAFLIVDLTVYGRWPSKPCLLFGRFEPGSLQQRWLCKNYIFGTATSYHGLKAVLSKEFAEHENEAVKL